MNLIIKIIQSFYSQLALVKDQISIPLFNVTSIWHQCNGFTIMNNLLRYIEIYWRESMREDVENLKSATVTATA